MFKFKKNKIFRPERGKERIFASEWIAETSPSINIYEYMRYRGMDLAKWLKEIKVQFKNIK